MELSNTGNVQLEYSWKVVMEEGGKAVNFATEPLSTSPEGTAFSTPFPLALPSLTITCCKDLKNFAAGLLFWFMHCLPPSFVPYNSL